MMLLVLRIEFNRYLLTLRWGHIDAMKRFSLRLTEAEYMKLKIHCDELQISMNDVIRGLIRDWQPRSIRDVKPRENGRKCI